MNGQFLKLAALAGLLVVAFGLAQAQASCTVTVQLWESVQAAIDQAPEGAVICLIAGERQENLKITKDLTLRGEGAEKSVILGGKEGPVILIDSPPGGDGVEVVIENLSVNGAIEAPGVIIEGTAQATIDNCTIAENADIGIAVLNSAQATITDSTISENETGIELSRLAKATLNESMVSKNNRGIVLRGATQASITGSTISESGTRRGITLWDSAQISITDSSFIRTNISLNHSAQATITGTVFSSENGGDAGIMLSNLARASLTGVRVSGFLIGIDLNGSTQATITDSTFSARNNGIDLTGSARATIERCSTSENRYCGIRMSGSAQASIMESTICMNGSGIGLIGSTQATITESTVSENELGIFLRDSAEASISDSTVCENELGIKVVGSAEATMSGSTVSKNRRGLHGFNIVLLDLARAIIAECSISRSETGIFMSGDTEATIDRSNIYENLEHGITLRGSARLSITGSTLSGHFYLITLSHSRVGIPWSPIQGYGIGLEDSAKATITGNTFSKNGVGIEIGDAANLFIEDNEILANHLYGVALHESPCFHTDELFTGYVTGKKNTIPGPDNPDGNEEGAFCPNELSFLTTEEGGELDRREQE